MLEPAAQPRTVPRIALVDLVRGVALIEAVYEAADAAGAPHVYWLTQEFNETARQLYDKVAKQTPFIKYSR